jgi:hypothetical protein
MDWFGASVEAPPTRDSHVLKRGAVIHDLSKAYCEEMNRLIQTRTPGGGVGGAPTNPGPLYSDRCSLLLVRPDFISRSASIGVEPDE